MQKAGIISRSKYAIYSIDSQIEFLKAQIFNPISTYLLVSSPLPTMPLKFT
jgi:hypothetical protein